MKRINLDRTYRFSPDGVRVDEYGPGEVEVPAEVAAVAIEDGAGTAVKEPPKGRAAKSGEASE